MCGQFDFRGEAALAWLALLDLIAHSSQPTRIDRSMRSLPREAMGKMTDLGGGSASARIGRTLNPFSAPLFHRAWRIGERLVRRRTVFFFSCFPIYDVAQDRGESIYKVNFQRASSLVPASSALIIGGP